MTRRRIITIALFALAWQGCRYAWAEDVLPNTERRTKEATEISQKDAPEAVRLFLFKYGFETPEEIKAAGAAWAKEFERRAAEAQAKVDAAKHDGWPRKYTIVGPDGKVVGVVQDNVNRSPKDFLRNIANAFNFWNVSDDEPEVTVVKDKSK